MNIGYFLGPAGSGKSHMTGALFDWMNQLEMEVITINLDPAVVRLPYSPDIDIRKYISYDDVVDKYELGPNGAIIAAMDQVALSIDNVINEMEEIGGEFALVDLPGQLEAFAYRSSGPLILRELGHDNNLAGLFLIDPILSNTSSSFVSILMLGASISYRLRTPLRFAVSKGDTISEGRLERIDEWLENPEFLMEDLRSEGALINPTISLRMAETLTSEEIFGYFPVISSQQRENIDLAFGEFQRIWNSEEMFS